MQRIIISEQRNLDSFISDTKCISEINELERAVKKFYGKVGLRKKPVPQGAFETYLNGTDHLLKTNYARELLDKDLEQKEKEVLGLILGNRSYSLRQLIKISENKDERISLINRLITNETTREKKGLIRKENYSYIGSSFLYLNSALNESSIKAGKKNEYNQALLMESKELLEKAIKYYKIAFNNNHKREKSYSLVANAYYKIAKISDILGEGSKKILENLEEANKYIDKAILIGKKDLETQLENDGIAIGIKIWLLKDQFNYTDKGFDQALFNSLYEIILRRVNNVSAWYESVKQSGFHSRELRRILQYKQESMHALCHTFENILDLITIFPDKNKIKEESLLLRRVFKNQYYSLALTIGNKCLELRIRDIPVDFYKKLNMLTETFETTAFHSSVMS